MAQVTMEGAEYIALVKQLNEYEELKKQILNGFELSDSSYPQIYNTVGLIMVEERLPLVIQKIADSPDFIKVCYEKGYRFLDKKTYSLYSTDYIDTVDLVDANERIAYYWTKLEEGTFDGEDEEV